MTRSQRNIAIKLLTGHFLRKQVKKGKSWYVLYDEKVNPIQKISARSIDRMDRFIDPEIKIWKKSKDGNITFNLSMIRRLHGKNTLKRLYKDRENLNDPGAIYKKRNGTKRKQHEKNYSLF